MYQGHELVQREQFEYNSSGNRKNYYHITYQGTDSIVQLIHYEYFNKHKVKRITISENDEKGIFHLLEVNEYDKADNLSKTESYIDATNLTMQEFTYTPKKQPKTIHWKVNGKTTAYATYHYNSHDLLVDYEYKTEEALLQIHHVYNKDYLLLEKIVKTDDKLTKKYHYTYLHFD